MSLGLVGCNKEKDPVTAKDIEEAISIVDEYIKAKDKNLYSKTDYELLVSYIAEATTALNDAKTKTKILEIVEEYKTKIDGITTFDYPALKTEVENAIKKLLDDLVEDEYAADIWAEMEKAISDAVKAVENAENNQTVINKVLTDVTTKIAEFAKIDIVAYKAASTTEVETIYSAIDAEEYVAENYEAITSLLDTCKVAIAAATYAKDVDQAVNTFKEEIAKVAKIDVEAVKTAALTEVEEVFANIDQTDYLQINYDKIVGYYNTCKQAINDAVKAVQVAPLVEDFKTDVAAVGKIDVDVYRVNVLESMNIYFNQLDADDYTTENYSAIEALYQTCNQAINDATKVSAMNEALNTFKAEVAKIVKIDVATYRVEAINTLTKYVSDNCIEEEYSSLNWANIQTIITNATRDINAADKAPAIDEIVENAKTAVSEVSKLTLTDYKNMELALIDEVFEALDETDYTEENWQIIQAAMTAAADRINAVQSKEELVGIVAEFAEFVVQLKLKV